jgi:hypothetical protein
MIIQLFRQFVRNSVSPFITINDLEIVKKRGLLFSLSFSKSLRKYFASDFWVTYDQDVSMVDPSLLYVPAVANLLPLAWATGVDIEVPVIDETFVGAVEQIQRVFRGWYPRLPFTTRVRAERVVSNRFEHTGYGMLFSGGVDSTATYILNREKSPVLIMLQGADLPHYNEKLWRTVRHTYRRFARENGVEIRFVTTNMRTFLHEDLVQATFGRFFSDPATFWGNLQHGVAMLGLCPPISVTESIGTLFLAPSGGDARTKPWGSHPLIDNKLAWADINVHQDEIISHLNKYERIRNMLKVFTESTQQALSLRSCWSWGNRETLNCNKCRKCIIIILQLIAANMDPNQYGFAIDRGFLKEVQRLLIQKELMLTRNAIMKLEELKQYIPGSILKGFSGSEGFRRWFQNFNFSKNLKQRNKEYNRYLIILYYALPRKWREIIFQLRPFRFVAMKLLE